MAVRAEASEHRADLYRPFLAALPVTGAAVSTLAAPFSSETVCASDPVAARLDEVQFDLGEGPCWDALSSRQPVLSENLHADTSRWPLFREALWSTPARALFAFPLMLGSLDIGAVDLYRRSPGALTDAQVTLAMALADICARQVLRYWLSEIAGPGRDHAESLEGFSRREVHQATGMVLAQLGVSAPDALLIIRGYAFARGRSVREVSADIVARRIDFAGAWADSAGPPADSL
jgi:GAF domain-containing protein